MQGQHTPRNARKADPRNARRCAREELRDQRTGKPNGFEIHAATIGRQNANPHLGHDLQQALVHRLLVAPNCFSQRHGAE